MAFCSLLNLISREREMAKKAEKVPPPSSKDESSYIKILKTYCQETGTNPETV